MVILVVEGVEELILLGSWCTQS